MNVQADFFFLQSDYFPLESSVAFLLLLFLAKRINRTSTVNITNLSVVNMHHYVWPLTLQTSPKTTFCVQKNTNTIF